MAIYVEWEFYMGSFATAGTQVATDGIPDAAIDFTSRARQMEVTASVQIGKVGSSSASVRIDNSDGAFTPFGGGTYEDWDWLANPIYIRAKTGTNPASLSDQIPLFIGVVSDVRYYDDGFSSYIDISADDAYTLIARTTADSEFDNIGAATVLPDIATTLWNNYTPSGSIPAFGSDFTYYTAYDTVIPLGYTRTGSFAGTTGEDLELIVEVGEFVGDALAEMAAAEHGVILPMRMDFDFVFGFPPFGSLRYEHGMIARDWLWTGSSAGLATAEYEFVEGTPTAAQMPFIRPQVGFNIDQIINEAAATVAGGITQSASGTSVATYGPRSVELSNLPMGFDTQALELAEHLVTRYDSVEYFVQSVTVTGGMIRDKCADAALSVVNDLVTQTRVNNVNLTNPGRLVGPLFHPAHIEFTGAGGVTLDSRVAFQQVSYTITPTDWEVTLGDGRDAVSTYGFVLGLDDYGVLGTNKVA
jgi:hypothetical protein